MFLTTIIVILLLVAAGWLLAGPTTTTTEERPVLDENGVRKQAYGRWVTESVETKHSLRAIAVIPLVLAGLLFLVAGSTIVGARTVGVPVTFGKPGDHTLDPGYHFKAPWTKVVKIDTTQQVDNYNNGDQDTDHSVVKVRLGNGSDAKIYASVSWEVNGKEATSIYGSYRSGDPTDLIYERLVAPNFKQAVQVALGSYDPTAAFKDSAATGDITGAEVNLAPDYDVLAGQVAQAFEGYIAKRGAFVTVLDVKVSMIELDKETQKSINRYQQEIQKTRIAQQAVKTSTEQAAANKILADSLAKTEDGAVAYCFSLIDQGKLTPPVGFSCYPGSGSSLILPAK